MEINPDVWSEEDRMLPFALSKIHHAVGAGFVIIIDEWDAMFREKKCDENAQQAYVELLRGLFKGEQSKDSFHRIKHVYNPSSVVRAMLSGEYENYWMKIVAYESMKDYISMNFDGLKEAVVQVLSGGRCKVTDLRMT